MSAHGHPHAHGHAHGQHVLDRRVLVLSLCLVLATMAAEIVVGLVADSLALLADAGHLLTDAVALGLAVAAASAAAKPPRGPWTFGFKRAEILSAQANGLILGGLAVWIAVEAVRRLLDPVEVDAELVGWVALAGLAVSLVVAGMLSRAQSESLNVKGAYLHVLGDIAAFVGTGIAAGLIVATGWNGFDPVASLVVAALLLLGAYRLLRESAQILMLAAPASAPPGDVGRAIAAHPGVVEAHDLHVFSVTSGFPALSAHVLVEPGGDCHRIRIELEQVLAERFGIEHTTLQVEHVGADRGLVIRRRSSH